MSASTLHRSHLRLLAFGLIVQLIPLLLVFILCAHPAGPATLLWALPAAVVTAAVELFALRRLYAPIRVLDALPAEERYAQNDRLSAGVVRLHNLPLLSFLRVYLLRAPLLTGLLHLLHAGLDPGIRSFAGTSAGAYWLLGMTLVPLLPAALEMLTLPGMIDRTHQEPLSYRGALSGEWHNKIMIAGTGVRVVVVVAVLCGAPLVALTLLEDLQVPADLLLLAFLALSVGAFVAFLMLRDGRRSVGSLLEGMRQVTRGRPVVNMPVHSGDEFSLAAEGFSSMVAGLKEQAFIRETFGKHVPKAIVEAVLRNGVKLHGERRTVAVLLVDIHRFRARLEQQSPVETVSLLNEYLAAVIAGAQHYGGTIDKVVGDRVLVVFGAPVTLNAPAERALFAALDIRRGVDRLNRRLEHGGAEPLRLSITVHHGEVVAGHVGAAERWEYSVLGRAVNEAYRIAEITRHHPVDIVASAPIRHQAGAQFRFAGPLVLSEEGHGSWELYSLIDHETRPLS